MRWKIIRKIHSSYFLDQVKIVEHSCRGVATRLITRVIDEIQPKKTVVCRRCQEIPEKNSLTRLFLGIHYFFKEDRREFFHLSFVLCKKVDLDRWIYIFVFWLFFLKCDVMHTHVCKDQLKTSSSSTSFDCYRRCSKRRITTDI